MCCLNTCITSHIVLLILRLAVPLIAPIGIFIQLPFFKSTTRSLKKKKIRARAPYFFLSHFPFHIHLAPFLEGSVYTYLHLYCEEEPGGMTMDFLCEVWSLKEAGLRCSMTSSPVSFVLCLSLSLCALHSRTCSDVVSELGVSLFLFFFVFLR